MNWFVFIYLLSVVSAYVYAGTQVKIWPRGFGEWLLFTVLNGITLFLVGYSVTLIAEVTR